MKNEDHIPAGRIAYNNVLPIFYPLESGIIAHPYSFTVAPPSTLNTLMRTGKLTISPISSVEYLKHLDTYYLMKDISIASHGEVMSVMLFSHKAIEELDSCLIALTEESSTSVLLLKLLCTEYFKIQPKYIDLHVIETTNTPCDAILRIGDSALHEQTQGNYEYQYDLGELWYTWTQLPFVFAVWGISKQVEQNTILSITMPLYEALAWSTANMDIIHKKAKENLQITDNEIQKYYTCLCYSLSELELAGLHYFATLLHKNSYIRNSINFTFLP